MNTTVGETVSEMEVGGGTTEPGAERLHARERYFVSNTDPRVRSLACSRSAPGSALSRVAFISFDTVSAVGGITN